MTYRYTSHLAPPSSTPGASVCQLLKEIHENQYLSKTTDFQLCKSTHSILLCLTTPDEICPLPVQIPVVKPDPDRANPKIGVSSLAFSSDSRYLATKNGKTLQLFTFTVFVNPSGVP